MAQAFELVADANRGGVEGSDAATALSEMLGLVGLGSLTHPEEGAEIDADAERLLAEREEARSAKDFARADALRDELAALGWEVRDSADGARLVPKARSRLDG
jgi:cysteinyl-tRNA synthetase